MIKSSLLYILEEIFEKALASEAVLEARGLDFAWVLGGAVLDAVMETVLIGLEMQLVVQVGLGD